MRRTPHDADDGAGHEAAHHKEGHDRLLYGALLDSVRGLKWRARRASRIAIPGIHNSRVRGTSAEFTEYRPYRHGDDLRRIDWKLFARSDRAHIRISEERAVTPTFVVLDASASMAFPGSGSSKWLTAQQVAVGLVAVAHSGGDPTGLIVAGHPRATIPPRTRGGIVAEIIRTLHGVGAEGGDPLASALILASRAAARIALISDFLGDLDDTIRAARELIASGRDVYAIHVIAPEEIEPPVSMSVVTDPEAPAVRRSMDRASRLRYTRAFTEWREDTAARWLESGAAYHTLVTGFEPVGHSVRRIVQDEPAVPQVR